MVNLLLEGIGLRSRLLRKYFYRIWKSSVIARAQKQILSVHNESSSSVDATGPAVVLCRLRSVRDLYVLMYLFRGREFSFVGLRSLQTQKTFKELASLNRVIFMDPGGKMYPFLRELLVSLRNFNRTVILFPKVEFGDARDLLLDPVVVVRIAMMANVPIVPVSVNWTDPRELKCNVNIGKRFFVSPASQEFRDIFFRRKGTRKFSRLDHDELKMVAGRIFSKLEPANGSNLS
jgi:1-acyl-sn-glycerol-3-phosphate acyltransferase